MESLLAMSDFYQRGLFSVNEIGNVVPLLHRFKDLLSMNSVAYFKGNLKSSCNDKVDNFTLAKVNYRELF